MPKHSFLSPKAISNRIKSKGLQKLKWYCQMCQKQCRDENGFKCHKTSEGHQRMMGLFAANSGRYISEFSRSFEKDFIQLLRLKGSRRVKANDVYQEYIQDRNHFHMNGTAWSTLTGFCFHLGRAGKAIVEKGERGIYITYIDQDPAGERRRQDRDKMLEDEERQRKRAQRRVQRIIEKNAQRGVIEETQGTELERQDASEVVSFGFAPKKRYVKADEDVQMKPPPLEDDSEPIKTESDEKTPQLAPPKEERPNREESLSSTWVFKSKKRKRGKPVLEELMEEQLQKKRRLNPTTSNGASSPPRRESEYWITTGILVKIMDEHACGGSIFKKKGEVVADEGGGVARIRVKKTNATVNVHQSKLETVIPALRREVKIVRGKYRGNHGIFREYDEKTGICVIEWTDTSTGRMRQLRFGYEDFSKSTRQVIQ